MTAFEVGAHEGSEDYPLPADDDADQHIRGVLAAVDRTHPPEPDAREERDTPTVDAGLSAWFSRALDAYYRTGLLPREECIAEALAAVGPPPSSETSEPAGPRDRSHPRAGRRLSANGKGFV